MAAPQTKTRRLDTSAGAAGARGAAAATAQGAELEARIIIIDEEEADVSHKEEGKAGEAGEMYTEEDEEGEGWREQHTQAPSFSLDGRLETGPDAVAGAAAAAQGAALQARIKVSKAKAEVAGLHAKVAEIHAKAAEVDTALAEAQLAVHVAEQEAGRLSARRCELRDMARASSKHARTCN